MPFIDKMCRSGVWIEALGQANAGLTWCTSRYQADWKRNFGQLLRQHVISDAIGYKLEVVFGLEPVSLLSIQCILTSPHRVKATFCFPGNAAICRLFFSCLFLLFSSMPLLLLFLVFPLFVCFCPLPPSAELLQREFVGVFLMSGCSVNMLYHAEQQKHAE